METIPITNFGGRLTRVINGKLDSGMAKFAPSWGYDPFTKPGNLTWFEKPVNLKSSILGGALITDAIIAAKIRSEANFPYVYALGNTGNLYKIQPNSQYDVPYSDSVVGVSSVKVGAAYTFGGSMEFYNKGSVEGIFIGHDQGINSIKFDGTAETFIGATGYYYQNVYRPLRQFAGNLIFGNGPTIGAIDSTGLVISTVTSIIGQSTVSNIYSEISPPFPPETVVGDMDVSPALDYLLITTSGVTPDGIASPTSRQAILASDSIFYKWNGIDDGATGGTVVNAYAVTALQTYLQNNYFFSNDGFGSSISDGVNKVLTLPGNKSPFPTATGSTGNFLYWISPEVSTDGTAQNASLYYFGSLDYENPSGLYRLMRFGTALSNGFTVSTPVTLLVDNYFKGVNNSYSSIASLSYGKHYFSTCEVNSTLLTVGGTGSVLGFYGFTLNPSGTVAPQLGVYETQTEMFSKKITVKQVRVYTESTVTGNGFQIDLIGSDGAIITNGSLTYSFAAGTNETLLQGALERIDFNPAMKGTFAVGVRITNTGTTNMTIKKIELDWIPSGK